MLAMILTALLGSAPNLHAQVQTCVWPNRCAVRRTVIRRVAQVQPCVWPRTCGVRRG